jgi:hypothetical protein
VPTCVAAHDVTHEVRADNARDFRRSSVVVGASSGVALVQLLQSARNRRLVVGDRLEVLRHARRHPLELHAAASKPTADEVVRMTNPAFESQPYLAA